MDSDTVALKMAEVLESWSAPFILNEHARALWVAAYYDMPPAGRMSMGMALRKLGWQRRRLQHGPVDKRFRYQRKAWAPPAFWLYGAVGLSGQELLKMYVQHLGGSEHWWRHI